MNASKETAVEAKDRLGNIVRKITELQADDVSEDDDIKYVMDFLECARRKLPTEASFARAKKPSHDRVKS